VLPYENENMFGLFKKKSEKEKLEAQYDALIKKSYELSHSNRAESDKVQAQAQEVLKQIEALEDWYSPCSAPIGRNHFRSA